MLSFLRHFAERLPGTIAIQDGHGFSLGHTASLPACNAGRRGEERLVYGGAGAADRRVLCVKDAAGAYAWAEMGLAALDSRYVNVTGGAVTVISGTATWNIGNIASGTRAAGQNVTVTGAALGDPCIGGLTSLDESWAIDCNVTAANIVTCTAVNTSGGTVDPASGTLRATCFQHG